MKEHVSTAFSSGQGVIDSSLEKQKINSRSLTKAKLSSIDNKISKIVWIKKILEI